MNKYIKSALIVSLLLALLGARSLGSPSLALATAILTTPLHLPEVTSIALRNGYPIILTEVGTLSNSTVLALMTFKPVKVIVVGLDTAMSILPLSVQEELEGKLSKILRPVKIWPWWTPRRFKEELKGVKAELERECLKVLSKYGIKAVEVRLVRFPTYLWAYPCSYYPLPPPP